MKVHCLSRQWWQEGNQLNANRPLPDRRTGYMVNKWHVLRCIRKGGGLYGEVQVEQFLTCQGGPCMMRAGALDERRGRVEPGLKGPHMTCDWPVESMMVVTWRSRPVDRQTRLKTLPFRSFVWRAVTITVKERFISNHSTFPRPFSVRSF